MGVLHCCVHGRGGCCCGAAPQPACEVGTLPLHSALMVFRCAARTGGGLRRVSSSLAPFRTLSAQCH